MNFFICAPKIYFKKKEKKKDLMLQSFANSCIRNKGKSEAVTSWTKNSWIGSFLLMDVSHP
jgi:subtilase family serine protease